MNIERLGSRMVTGSIPKVGARGQVKQRNHADTYGDWATVIRDRGQAKLTVRLDSGRELSINAKEFHDVSRHGEIAQWAIDEVKAR